MHRHGVIRETGSRRNKNALSPEATQRWTVSHSAMSLKTVRKGHGFAWFPEAKIPEAKIRVDLESGQLRKLPLRDGEDRFADLYLILSDPDSVGPGALGLAEIIRSVCQAS